MPANSPNPSITKQRLISTINCTVLGPKETLSHSAEEEFESAETNFNLLGKTQNREMEEKRQGERREIRTTGGLEVG